MLIPNYNLSAVLQTRFNLNLFQYQTNYRLQIDFKTNSKLEMSNGPKLKLIRLVVQGYNLQEYQFAFFLDIIRCLKKFLEPTNVCVRTNRRVSLGIANLSGFRLGF